MKPKVLYSVEHENLPTVIKYFGRLKNLRRFLFNNRNSLNDARVRKCLFVGNQLFSFLEDFRYYSDHSLEEIYTNKSQTKLRKFYNLVNKFMVRYGDNPSTKNRDRLIQLFNSKLRNMEVTEYMKEYATHHIKEGIDFHYWSDRCASPERMYTIREYLLK